MEKIKKGNLKKLKYKQFYIACIFLIFISTFAVFFADGYLQVVNSDTASEACATAQNIKFPQGLFSETYFHSRITATILSFVPFNIAGGIYREITNDPVSSLYFSQGVMTGTIYLLLVFISAAYIAVDRGIFSNKFLLGSLIMLLLSVAFEPMMDRQNPFEVTFRYNHQAVMSNYVGTMMVVLFSLYPFWRFALIGRWEDFYNNIYLRTIFYILLFFSVFSSSSTTIWILIFSLSAFLWIILKTIDFKKLNINIILRCIKNNSIFRPLIFIIFFGLLAIYSETTTIVETSRLEGFDFKRYIKNYAAYLFTQKHLLFYFISALFFTFIFFMGKTSERLSQKNAFAWKVFVFLLITNFIYSFIIGIPQVSYRFQNTNLGRDTLFPLILTITIIVVFIIINFWEEKKLLWLAPFLAFVLITNGLSFFSFPIYGNKVVQERIFRDIYQWDQKHPQSEILALYPRFISFSKRECEEGTIPMLKNTGIISPYRKVMVLE